MKLIAIAAVAMIAFQLGTWSQPAEAAVYGRTMYHQVDDCRFGLRFRDAVAADVAGKPTAQVITLNDHHPAGAVCIIQKPSVDFVRADGSPGGYSGVTRPEHFLRKWLVTVAFQEDASATAVGGNWYLIKKWYRDGRDYCAEIVGVTARTGDGHPNGIESGRERVPLFPGAVCPP